MKYYYSKSPVLAIDTCTERCKETYLNRVHHWLLVHSHNHAATHSALHAHATTHHHPTPHHAALHAHATAHHHTAPHHAAALHAVPAPAHLPCVRTRAVSRECVYVW